jgi:hypothetical protein
MVGRNIAAVWGVGSVEVLRGQGDVYDLAQWFRNFAVSVAVLHISERLATNDRTIRN